MSTGQQTLNLKSVFVTINFNLIHFCLQLFNKVIATVRHETVIIIVLFLLGWLLGC